MLDSFFVRANLFNNFSYTGILKDKQRKKTDKEKERKSSVEKDETKALRKYVEVSFSNSNTDKMKLIEEIAEVISNWLDNESDAQAIAKGIKEREVLSTTGFGNGFAIPHGKAAGLESPILAIFKLENEVEWDSLDDEAITQLFVILVPVDEAQDTHLTLLSTLSYHLMDEEVQRKINEITENEAMKRFIEMIFKKGR